MMRKERGAITLYVAVVCLFILTIGITAYIGVSNKQAAQIATLSKIEEQYKNTELTEEDLYGKYEGGEIIPIFTPEQFAMVGSGETNYSEETGRIYTYTTDKTYMFYGQSEDLTDIINTIVEQRANEIIESKNYITEENVNEIVENKSYVTEDGVNKIITDKNYVTNERLAELESSIASIGFPDYANRTELTSGVQYTADANMYAIVDTTSSHEYGSCKVVFEIDGVKYTFSEGYGGTDWIHPTNAIIPIAKGSVFKITIGTQNSPKLYKVYAK